MNYKNFVLYFNGFLSDIKNIKINKSNYKNILPGSDVGLAVSVAALLSILVVPLPTFILDIGLSVSITISFLILMVALFLRRPLDFTSFPTLLLLTTLLRLALEVATTRLILGHGSEGIYAAGHVVAAFGGFLMGGDVVIGGILFSILLIVNFMVITKGSGRIAEVAARFSLDAMPGKQMAIDAELASGGISDKEARKKRKELEEESGFYGSMDGAAKFVRGDAIAGLIITAINIIGGLTIGVVRHGMPLSEAASSFTTLTIGDGLVSQIPALLVSTAAGIVVTKGGTEGATDATLIRQLGSGSKPLALVAGGSVVLSLMPGLPALPFLGIGLFCSVFSWVRHNKSAIEEKESVELLNSPASNKEPSLLDTIKIDMIRVELGFSLLSLASGDNTLLTDQIKILRRTIAHEMGFVIPPVRIQDNLQLPPDNYSIKIKEIEVGSGTLRPNHLLVMNPHGGLPALQGEITKEPAFGLQAMWVDISHKEEAAFANYTVVDAASVLVTHLSELVRENLAELVTYSETQKLLDSMPRDQQKLVSDIIPSQISLGAIQRVFQSLVSEKVSIRDLVTILEAVQEACGLGMRIVPQIVSHVRMRLCRQISASVVGPNGYIPIVSLSPNWENIFLDSIVGPPEDRQLAMPPSKLNEFIKKIKLVFDDKNNKGEAFVFVVGEGIRESVKAIIERLYPSTMILSQREIAPKTKIKTVYIID